MRGEAVKRGSGEALREFVAGELVSDVGIRVMSGGGGGEGLFKLRHGEATSRMRLQCQSGRQCENDEPAHEDLTPMESPECKTRQGTEIDVRPAE